MAKPILILMLLLSCSVSLALPTYFPIRSQGENAARGLVGAGWNTYTNLADQEDNYGNIAIVPEYTRSFRPYQIAECLFGNRCGDLSCDDKCYRINISGTQVEKRKIGDLFADHFGLPTDYKSYVTFEPRIENFLVDFYLYFGLDRWCKGAYFKVHAPVVYSRWDLKMCEHIENPGTNNYWPGYFNDNVFVNGETSGTITDPWEAYGIARNNLVRSFESFISCCDTIKDSKNSFDFEILNTHLPFTSHGITFDPLCHAKMSTCNRKKAGLADIQVALGWNWWLEDYYHAGFNICGTIPTGNRPTGEYLFEPIVGNGKHGELGVGFSGHYTFCCNEDEEKYYSIFCDANITHLFKTKQCRTFDLKNKPLSRYMLAAKFGTPIEYLHAGETFAPAYPDDTPSPVKQFKGIYTSVANLTTFAVDVSSSVQADVALMLQGVRGNWSMDIGYNLWARSCEKIKPRDCFLFEDNTWGIKGDAFMYGAATGEIFDQTLPIFMVPLSATQSQATICQGTNNYPNGDTSVDPTITWSRNPGIDNRQRAWSDATMNPAAQDGAVLIETTELKTGFDLNDFKQIYTSYEPVLIQFSDIDFDGAQTKGLSHKIFTNLDYTWRDCECWTPWLGIGAEAEFAYHDSKSCDSLCTGSPPCRCTYCALSQWGIWIKGGVAYS